MPSAANKGDFERYQRGKKLINSGKSLYSQLKHNVSTPFALVESLGLWCGLNMTLKSLSPELSSHSVSTIKSWLKPALQTKVAYELSETDAEQGLSLQEQISYAETVLRLMGLTSGFAKLIILCGHGSTTENNPYASALDCGACGGNHGGINARLLASILNKREVRQGLEDCGMHIPLDTVFYGALHNTTTDNVIFGSGSKVTHNVVGTIGVMQGNGSDLMHGLPLQSVMSSDDNTYHEPQRLLTVVYAPKEMVSQVIEKHSILKTLFFNQWVHLVVIDPNNQRSYQLNQSGEWNFVE